MMNSRSQALSAFLALAFLATCSRCGAIEELDEAATQVEQLVEELREEEASQVNSERVAQVIDRLNRARTNAEVIKTDLEATIKEYDTRQRSLERVQTVLTSGLIGAVVTAIVAIIGAFASVRASMPERDLKRLAVIEKARELRASGVQLPEDISNRYFSDEGAESS